MMTPTPVGTYLSTETPSHIFNVTSQLLVIISTGIKESIKRNIVLRFDHNNDTTSEKWTNYLCRTTEALVCRTNEAFDIEVKCEWWWGEAYSVFVGADRYGICTSRSDGIYQVSAGASSGLVLSLLENSPFLPQPLSPSSKQYSLVKFLKSISRCISPLAIFTSQFNWPYLLYPPGPDQFPVINFPVTSNFTVVVLCFSPKIYSKGQGCDCEYSLK